MEYSGKSGFFAKCGLFIGVPVYLLVFPVFVSLGGSVDLLNWGPGILVSGIAGLLLALGNNRKVNKASDIHGWLWFFLLGFLFWRASISSETPLASITSDASLIALAGIAYVMGKSAGERLSCALIVGLAVTVFLNLACILVQMSDPEWNLIYAQRSGGFPSGLFAHYNYSASFCLGAIGLLVSRSRNETGFMKWLMIIGAIAACGSVPLTLSRGGNLGLAVMVVISLVLIIARGFRGSTGLLNVWIPALLIVPTTVVAAKYLVPLLDRNVGADGFYQDGGRVGFWRAALQLTGDSPWFGSGADSFSLNVYRVMENLGHEPDKVHNEALQMAVDYGYPALVAIVLLIAAPVFWSMWRFLSGSDSEKTVWESIGLVGMLVQANFSFVFHVGTGVFLAGIILGRISYGLKSSKGALSENNEAVQEDGSSEYRQFLIQARSYAHDYLSGNLVAASSLVSHFGDKEDPWFRYRSRILFHIKTSNSARLDNVVKEIKAKCVSELCSLAEVRENVDDYSVRGIFGKFILSGAAALIVMIGINYTHALVEIWPVSFGRGDRMANWQRFEKLISLKESYPFAAVERKVLSAALDCIYQFDTAAAREYWAEGSRRRIEDAVSGASGDPLVALQLACVLGWAGDVEMAMRLYDRAIRAQGNNETLFMANAFKGQYYYELALAAQAAGQDKLIEDYAQNAVYSLLDSQRSLESAPWKFSKELAAALDECRQLAKP